MKKNIKGLTLIETMVSLTLLTLIILGSLNYFIQRQEKIQAKKLSNDMILILNAVDKKMQLDAFNKNSWINSNWDNNEDFLNVLVKKELRTSNSSCGVSDGWKTDLVNEPLTLIPCDRWNGNKLPFDLNVKAGYTYENKNGIEVINNFKIDYYFKNDKDFEDNINKLLTAKKSLDKYENSKNITVHTYDFFNISNDDYINVQECLNLKSNCGLRTQVEVFSGISTDKLRIDGKNKLMGEIDFNSNNQCTEWKYVSGKWIANNVKCSITGGFDSGDFVEAKINNTTITDRISLNKLCEVANTEIIAGKEWISATNNKVPCGLSKDGSIISSGFDKVNSEMTISLELFTTGGYFELGNIKNDAKFHDNLDVKVVKAEKSVKSDSTKVDTNISSNFLDSSQNIISQNLTSDNYINNLNLISKSGDLNLILNNDTAQLNKLNIKETANSNILIDTRNFNYVPTNGGSYNKIKGIINNNIQTTESFYSGYTPLAPTDATVEKTYNILKMNDLSGNSPKIKGTTKDRNTIRVEMNKPTASDLEVDVYKDGKTFYSDINSKLSAKQLSSDGVLFTQSTPATGTTISGYDIAAENGLVTETIKQYNGGIYVKRKNNNRVTVTNGQMKVVGENLGSGNTTAELVLTWPTSDEGHPGFNGFRNKVFRSSLTPIINGTTRVFGSVVQWKPFHVNSVYKGYSICDRPNGVQGACLMTTWFNLNQTQSVMNNVQSEYDKLSAKLPPLKGEKGSKGEQGFKGEKGLQGYKGAKGKTGPQGPMEYLIVN